MFTGIVTAIGTIADITPNWRITIESPYPAEDLALGESIACSGVCLTVVDKKPGSFAVEVSPETLAVTADHWRKSAKLNLERALAVGDRLGGHFVSGHVDGLATVKAISREQDAYAITLEVPEKLKKFIAPKGSVTLDGVSLTVNTVTDKAFTVMIIPHTWKETTLSAWQPGAAVNLEVDLIARYLERLTGSNA